MCFVSVTPAEYEPPGFKASDYDAFNYDDDTVNVRLGDVATVSCYKHDHN